MAAEEEAAAQNTKEDVSTKPGVHPVEHERSLFISHCTVFPFGGVGKELS
jgi:hypothetical protein